MKPIDVKVLLMNIMKNLKKNILNFKVADHVRMSKYKNNFAKGYAPD